jgi:hypothetical protein
MQLMNRLMRKLVASAIGLMAFVALTPAVLAQAPVPAPKVEDFFRHSKFSSATLSPNGQFLAALAPLP